MITIEAEPRELAEFLVAMRDGEFGADPAEGYYSREDAMAEVNGMELHRVMEERDDAFALAAIHPLTLEDLAGKSEEELTELLADRSFAIRRGVQAMTTGELIAELKRREGVKVVKIGAQYTYVISDDEAERYTCVGPATILVINEK